jgi:hypothetical protein
LKLIPLGRDQPPEFFARADSELLQRSGVSDLADEA